MREFDCCKHTLPLRVFKILALSTLVACVVGFAIQWWCYRPVAFGDSKTIRRIDVWLDNEPEQTIAFTVADQATIMQILDAIKPFSLDRHPAKWQTYGFFRVEFANGTKAEVAIFSVDEEVAAFSINRVYYRGGSEPKLRAILDSKIPKGIKRHHAIAAR